MWHLDGLFAISLTAFIVTTCPPVQTILPNVSIRNDDNKKRIQRRTDNKPHLRTDHPYTTPPGGAKKISLQIDGHYEGRTRDLGVIIQDVVLAPRSNQLS